MNNGEVVVMERNIATGRREVVCGIHRATSYRSDSTPSSTWLHGPRFHRIDAPALPATNRASGRIARGRCVRELDAGHAARGPSGFEGPLPPQRAAPPQNDGALHSLIERRDHLHFDAGSEAFCDSSGDGGSRKERSRWVSGGPDATALTSRLAISRCVRLSEMELWRHDGAPSHH